MRLALIACGILTRELGGLVGSTPHEVDVRFLEQGLHDRPARLRAAVQAEIDRLDDAAAGAMARGERPLHDAIVLAYGLCGTGTAGLRSASHRLVLPRAHDCFTLVLGCRRRYRAAFDEWPATYWCTPGWSDHGALPDETRLARNQRELAARHGEDAAAYLLELERASLGRYERCAFVAWPRVEHGPQREKARRTAAERGWTMAELEGDAALLHGLLAGAWDERYLVVEPGAVVTVAGDERVMVAA